MKALGLVASVAAALGIGWFVYGRKPASAPAASPPGVVPPPDAEDLPPEFRPDTPTGEPKTAGAHRGARPIVEAAFRLALGRDGTPDELLYVQAVAWVETNYGRGWRDARCPGGSTSNNWGAVQARSGPQFPCEDSHPDGTRYKQGFRVYASPQEGAADVVRHVIKNRPKTAAALTGKPVTVYRASYAMRREVYYGGFCPKAVARFGSAIAIPSYKTPDRDEGTRACAREAIELHAKKVHSTINDIAASLGVPSMALGTYDDADAWYRKEFLA